MEKHSPVNEAHEMDSSSLSQDASTHEVHSGESKGDMDERNPQNWSQRRKTLLFLALMSSSLLADGYVYSTLPMIVAFKLIQCTYRRAMVWGGTLITPQAMEWGISINKSATSMNWGILLQGFGGLFAVPLVEAYGR